MTKADIHHQDKRFEAALERHLPTFNGDREVVKNFLDQLVLERLSSARISKYVFTLGVLKRMLGKNLIEADEAEIKGLVAKIEKSDKSDWTKHGYRVILKRFLRYLGKEPSWLKAGKRSTGDILPEEILTLRMRSKESLKTLTRFATRALCSACMKADAGSGSFCL